MKEEILKDFRQEYIKRLEENEINNKSLNVLKNRKKILENSPLVKEYIELNKQIDDVTNKIFTADDIFTDTLYNFNNIGLTDETNNIYLYAGSFINEYGYERQVERDDSIAEFDKYINIESFENIDIPVEDRENFENSYRVLILDSNVPVKYLKYEIRDQFINDALLEGQEAACHKVLSRNKKNL